MQQQSQFPNDSDQSNLESQAFQTQRTEDLRLSNCDPRKLRPLISCCLRSCDASKLKILVHVDYECACFGLITGRTLNTIDIYVALSE